MADEEIKQEGQEKLTDEEASISAEADKIVKLEEAENKAEARLDIVFGESTPESEKSTSDESDEKKTDEPEVKDESTSETTDESKTEDESTSEESDDKTDMTDKTADDTKLTQAEIRAAIHQGWKQEDIDELVKTNPGLAKRTCAKLLEGTNNLSQKFAELGKKVLTPVAKTKEEPVKHESKRKPIDLTKIEQEYEGDPLIEVLKQVVEENNSFAEKLDRFESSSTTPTEADTKKAEAEAAEDAAIGQQIDVFFKSPDLSSYKEFYGAVPKDSKNWDNLTQGQIKNRWEVVNQANLIITGAKQQGVEMSLDEAFEKAHLLTTAKVSAEVIRKKIKSDVKKRSNSLTLEPSTSKGGVNTEKTTQTERENRAGQRLKKVFG